MRALLFSLLLAVFALSALADTEVTGKWSGTFSISGPNGEGKDGAAYLVLKQSGADITGSVGPSEDEQYPIVKGKIEGDKITIEVNHEGHAVKFALVLAEDRITGNANISGDGGETSTAKLDVKRVK